MRNAQRASYADRIERAVVLLQQGMAAGDLPNLAQMASAAALSEYHFHRIFRLMTGETVGQAISRVRLGGSLPALGRQGGINEATGLGQYATAQAYARALRERTGHSPSQLQRDPARRANLSDALANPAQASGQPIPLSIQITSLEPLQLVAVRNVGDYAELNAGFGRLFDLLMEKVSPDAVTGLWGIPHDDPRETPADVCRFDCAVTLVGAPTPDGSLDLIDCPAGPCLRMEIGGDYDAIHPAIDALYTHALAQDLVIDNIPVIIHYHHDPDEVAETDLRASVFLMLSEEG